MWITLFCSKTKHTLPSWQLLNHWPSAPSLKGHHSCSFSISYKCTRIWVVLLEALQSHLVKRENRIMVSLIGTFGAYQLLLMNNHKSWGDIALVVSRSSHIQAFWPGSADARAYFPQMVGSLLVKITPQKYTYIHRWIENYNFSFEKTNRNGDLQSMT